MSTHPRRGLALALVLAGTLAGSALAGPAMAADDPSGGDLGELITVRKAGGDQQEYLSMRKAGGDPESIIAVL